MTTFEVKSSDVNNAHNALTDKLILSVVEGNTIIVADHAADKAREVLKSELIIFI